MLLQQRKRDLIKLFKKMQQWQFEKVREEPDKALIEDYRILEDDDIERLLLLLLLLLFTNDYLHRLDSVQTEEELADVYSHFMLYYGKDLVSLKNKEATLSKDKTTNDVDGSEVKEGTIMKQAKR